jgi:uroporphyrinogen-III synthase
MTVHLALRTVTLESRRGAEMARLLTRHGLVPIEAPSMREVPLTDQSEALAFGDALMRGECDVLVLLTGVGTRALLDVLRTRWDGADVLHALGQIRIACRGPKPVAVLKELGLKPSVLAPEPNTWRELLAALAPIELRGQRLWVQEYGKPNAALLAGLAERGALVHSAAVYAWQLPEDVAPLRHAIEALCNGDAEVVMFTSGRQFDHMLEVAESIGRTAALRTALARDVLVVSIGPVTSEGLVAHGVRADLEPAHPKMGHMVKALAEEGLLLLERKRAAHGASPG